MPVPPVPVLLFAHTPAPQRCCSGCDLE
jgi:hypothetical protein